ncbi:MAG: tRNA (N6-threonylcarbamoyladenosine(37)-N6)-methyltransferase TrmO [Gammaproteobacteria bacterium]|nr:tRNA (N6-threonylcarbamoyladenosine(37)-N6)-methyltransferase TrmO [Gammaproteobacteria bacterium]
MAYLRSPLKEKFGTPRQPGLAPQLQATVELIPPYNCAAAFEGIEHYSHLWLLFHFHQTAAQGWRPRVRPPRLGGNRYIGLFATRTMFRPNPIGLSLVQLLKVEQFGDTLQLAVAGADLIDATPILDIKPYLPFIEAKTTAAGGFAATQAATLKVSFDPLVIAQLKRLEGSHPQLGEQLTELLTLDPRPAYQQDERYYGLRYADFNLKWQVVNGVVRVVSLGQC